MCPLAPHHSRAFRYGDLESFAKHSAAKQSRKESRAASGNTEKAGGDETGDDGAVVSDDPFCSRMLEGETAPLRERIAELEAENAMLKRQLELVSEPLIHEDL